MIRFKNTFQDVFSAVYFFRVDKKEEGGHANPSNKMMSAGMLEPPSTSHPEHTGKVSVRKKVGENWIHRHRLAAAGANQACTLSDWLQSFAFIVPSRQAAAV